MFIKTNDKRQQVFLVNDCDNSDNDSGIKSNIDTDNMIPAARDKQDEMILSCSFCFMNMGIIPISVANPDRVVMIKDSFI